MVKEGSFLKKLWLLRKTKHGIDQGKTDHIRANRAYLDRTNGTTGTSDDSYAISIVILGEAAKSEATFIVVGCVVLKIF